MTESTVGSIQDRIWGGLGLREGGQWAMVLKKIKNNKLAMIGLFITVSYFLIAIVGPYLAPHDPTTMQAANRLAPPSVEHPFGTDRYGRDILSRVISGAAISLKVASAVLAFSGIVGVTVGLIAGYFRGWVDEAIMRLVDVLFAFPSILLGLIVIAILGPGLDRTILALAIAYTPVMIRVTRGSALSVRMEEYVLAAITYGESSWNIMFRDMLPNLISAVMVQATITFAFAILSESALSFIGLSAQPPTPTWGVMITTGKDVILIAPWATIFPGLAIMVTVLGLTFLGVGLRDAFDPKTSVQSEGFGGI